MAATPPGSVTSWIPGLRQGDQQAIQALWDRYFNDLVRIADRYLRGAPGRAIDGEDAAIKAFHRFCEVVQKTGRYPDLSSRDGLMRLLARFAVWEALACRRREERYHRLMRGDSALGEAGVEGQAGEETPPTLQAEVADLIARLPDADLRQVAQLVLEGYTNAEIARQLGVCVATIELRRACIRSHWKADWAELNRPSNREERT